MKRIAIEEAFVTAEIAAEWKNVLAGPDVEPGFAKMGESILAETPGNALLHARLLDIGRGRIAHMDEVGI
ncbi:MAG: amidohydrolase, partial [Bradyrhizobium sp.]|nr:amidohydrolase [Bradyrhizobium sp.]